MPVGPGIYDKLCTFVREQTEARMAIVVVLGGNKGSGFSVQADQNLPPSMLANILSEVVDELRAAADSSKHE